MNGYCWEFAHQLNTVRECITLVCSVVTLEPTTGLRALLMYIVLKRCIPSPSRLHAFKHRTCMYANTQEFSLRMGEGGGGGEAQDFSFVEFQKCTCRVVLKVGFTKLA